MGTLGWSWWRLNMYLRHVEPPAPASCVSSPLALTSTANSTSLCSAAFLVLCHLGLVSGDPPLETQPILTTYLWSCSANPTDTEAAFDC